MLELVGLELERVGAGWVEADCGGLISVAVSVLELSLLVLELELFML